MSHFTVAVITPSLDSLEDLLAPFQENNMGDCPEAYLEFINVEAEYKQRYETDTAEYIELEEGDLVSAHDPMFCKPIMGGMISTQEIPMHLKRVQVPHNQVYSSFDEFMVQYMGYLSKDDKTDAWGYWENPNAKWDWWKIGGRWSNMLLLRSGEQVNVAQIKDIFFIEQEQCEGVTVEIEGMPVPIDLAPKFQIGVAEASQQWEMAIAGKNLYKPEYYMKRYVNKQGFLREMLSIKTYAVLTPDGTWHASGEMGWFGISSESPEEARHFSNSYYDAFIKSADPEHFLVIVDCHI